MKVDSAIIVAGAALSPGPILISLVNEARQFEKKYEWPGAAERYIEALDLALEEKDFSEAAQLCEQLGHCFYKFAYQAEISADFKMNIEQSIRAYERASDILELVDEEAKGPRVAYAKALASHARSRLEEDPVRKKTFIDKSYAFASQALAEYERLGDLNSVGRVCNHLLELLYSSFWIISDLSERDQNKKEGVSLAEKAIHALNISDRDSELAKAYRYASWNILGGTRPSKEQAEKSQIYSEKALEFSKRTGDAALISSGYLNRWNLTTNLALDLDLSIDSALQAIRYGTIAGDNFAIGMGNCFLSNSMVILSKVSNDPDKQKDSLKKAKEAAEYAIGRALIINEAPILFVAYPVCSIALTSLATIETNAETKFALFEAAIRVNKEGLEHLRHWKGLHRSFFLSLAGILPILSENKSEAEEKKKLLLEAQTYANNFVAHLNLARGGPFLSQGYYRLAEVQKKLAEVEDNRTEKMELLNKALGSIEASIELFEKTKTIAQTDLKSGYYYGPYWEELGSILQKIHRITKEEEKLRKAIHAYKEAGLHFEKANLPTSQAESYWRIAQLYGQLGEHENASQNFELASKTFDIASRNVPALTNFCKEYSLYMQAWSQIEQARFAHSNEEYGRAKERYERAAELHSSTESWSYLAPNYSAWAKMEEAESLSRKESTQKAKEAFQKTLERFIEAEKSIKEKIKETTSPEEKELTTRLLEASDLRRRFCQARIQIEEAKLLDRKGEYLQSSKSYGEAAQKISYILDKVDVDAERNELGLLAILCKAWAKMATAEETASSESYLQAADLFEQAKEQCYTKKVSLWTLGNSSFCKGLAAGARYQVSMDLEDNALAKSYLKGAASAYLQAGFEGASEYAMATQRLFDAYVFMRQAEGEVSPECRAKQYQMAENLLQLAAGSFMKAKQPEKTVQVQQMIRTVREEKALAVSLSDVLHAPSVSSSTFSFAAPSSTGEVSVGLEQFEHANVRASLIAASKEVKVGESFCLSVELVNAGREPALLLRVEDFVPPDFVVVEQPEIYRLEESCLNMKGKQIAPLKLVEVKLVLQPSRKGLYQLKPTVHYLDELGQNRSLQLKSVEITVEEVILSDRVSTGTRELDSLLLGGIPKEYAVVLTGPPSDEREQVIRNFLDAGTMEGQTSFYVSAEPFRLGNLLERNGFFLFLCNPKPKFEVPDLPNVYRLHAKTDLTNLNIALLKACRNVEHSSKKRVCIETVSDVLVDYGVKATRKWVAELTTDLVSRGFTVLAVMNPGMHPSDQAMGVMDLFDGEISLYQTEDSLECKKSLRIKKLRNKDFIKTSVCLIKPTN